MTNPFTYANNTRMFVESTEKVEEFLRNQGVLQNSLEFDGSLKFSGAFKQVNMRVPSIKADESSSLEEEQSGCGHNFLSKCPSNLD
jgi:hypothetical protein